MTEFFKNNTGSTNTWITPKYIIDALGAFDLDPCCAVPMPWKTAEGMFSLPEHDGLKEKWFGRVWLNPPYSDIFNFMHKMSIHNNGIALIYARTDTRWFVKTVWEKAHSILFIYGRIRFYDRSGFQKFNSTAPSVLVAYGADNTEALIQSNIRGHLVSL